MKKTQSPKVTPKGKSGLVFKSENSREAHIQSAFIDNSFSNSYFDSSQDSQIPSFSQGFGGGDYSGGGSGGSWDSDSSDSSSSFE